MVWYFNGIFADKLTIKIMIIPLLALFISFLFFVQIELSVEGISLITAISSTVLDMFFLFVLIILGGNYLELIESISKRKLPGFYYMVMGALSHLIVILYEAKMIIESYMLSSVFIIIIISWYKNGRILCKEIVCKVPLKEKDKEIFLINNPPRKRSDLLILDLVIGLVIIMPILLTGYWG